MNKHFQSAEDFHGKLNMSIFTNLEKAYSKEDIAKEFGSDSMILEKPIISAFIQEVYNTTGGEIVKGKFNDLPEAHNIIEKAKADLAELTVVKMRDEGGIREVYIMKAKSPDSFEKGKENDLEKGHVDSAFGYSNHLVFSKTGKDIKEKCVAEKARIELRISTIETAIAAHLANCQGAELPTEKPYMYGRKEMINCPYLRYHYCLTDYWEGRDLNSVYKTDSGSQIYPVSSSDDAKTHNDYNNLVSNWIDEKSDIQILDLFANNLEDSKKYDLSAEQMLSLGF